MKKIILTMFAATIAVTAVKAQVAVAPEIGLNLANMAVKSDGQSQTTSMKAGLAVGGVIDLGLSDNLYLQPGIFYLMNGCDFSGGSYNVSTIQIPVNLEYKLGEEGGNRFFFGVGPYIGYNVGGNVKSDGNSTSLQIGSNKPDANGNGGDDIKALDFGVGINVGYQLAKGFYARAHYQMGLTNLDPMADANNSIKTSAIGITVGYYFGGKKASKDKSKK